ncbi:MAG: caspase family protein [Phormidium sp.]
MNSEWEALVVGINRYPAPTTLKDLTAAGQDAETIAGHLKDYGYQAFRVQCLPQKLDQKGNVKVDFKQGVRLEDLQQAVANLFNPPSPNEVPETALFFFSGHGWHQTVDGKDEVFLATSDAFPIGGNYGLSLRWLGEEIQNSAVKRVIVWLDCCYSGELMKFLPTNKDYCFITATRSYEPGLEISLEQGLFTKALLEGLNSENYPEGIVNSHNLAKFIEKQMAQTSQRPLIANSQRAILLTTKSPKKRFENTCPYRSLSYFTEKPEDAKVFYGRNTLTKELISRIENKHRFITVLGASGSGKSSLLRAGLLYQLKLGQEIPGSDSWIYLEPFTPQGNPLENLEAALGKGTGEKGLGTGEEFNSRFQPTLAISLRIDSQAGSLGGVQPIDSQAGSLEGVPPIDSQAGSLEGVQPVVMVIDQFEEAFTMCDETQRQEFFNHLIELNQNNPNLYIIMGMRSDFRSRLREHPQLTERIEKPYINVGHLNREEIEEAIVKPAELVGLGIEGALKQQIINDVEDYPGSLPLLQFTLTELWNEAQKQGEQFLRLATYQSLGGIEGTLQKRADAVYESLGEAEKSVAKRLFLELTQVGETLDTRRRVYLDDLVNSHQDLAILDKVTQILANEQNRLITRTEDPISEKLDEQSKSENQKSKIQIDVVHEALIRHWKRLRDWQQQYQDAMIVEREMENQAHQWEAAGKPNDPGLLLQGAKLAKAVDYLSKYGELGMLDGVAEDFIRISRQQDKNRRFRQRLTIGGVMGVVSLAAVVATFFGLESRKQATMASLREAAANIKVTLSVNTSPTPLIQAIQLTGKSQDSLRTVLSEVYSSLYDAVDEVRESNMFTGDQGSVRAVAFSPDGKTILSSSGDNTLKSSGDNTLKLWDTSGKLLKIFTGDQSPVRAVAFSPDGKTILSSSWDKTLKLWDTSGKLLKTFTGDQSPVSAVAFSPDGKTILSGSDDKKLKLWDTSGKLLQTFTGDQSPVSAVAFSPDGKTILSGSDDKKLKLWDTSGKLLQTFTGHQGYVLAVAFSPDGKTILSGSYDNTLKLWDISGKLLKTFTGHQSSVSAVAFSPDGKTILSGSWDKTLKLWDTSGKLPKTFPGHQGSVRAVAFSPDGKTILSGSDDSRLKLWDTSGKLLKNFTGDQSLVSAVAFSPDGKTILSGSGDSRLKLWDTSGKLLKNFTGDQSFVSAVAFSRDGKTILSGSGDSRLKLWDTSGKLLQTFTGHQTPVLAVAFSPDGKTILSGSGDKTLKLWDTSGKLLKTFTGHQDSVNAVAFSPDGKTILSGSGDKTLKLWDTSGKLLQTFTGHQDSVNAVAFSPDGKYLLSGSDDKTLKLWDTSGKLLQTFSGHQDSVRAVAFSPDGKYLLSGSDDKTLKLWPTPENWQYVLQVGCSRLRWHPQLASPDNVAAGETCRKYGGWKKTEEAHFLVRQGKALVQEKGDGDQAMQKLTEAKKLDPNLNLAAWKTELAPDLIQQGEKLAKEGNVKEALTAYEKAQQFDPKLKVSAESWNTLCWNGSLYRSAKEVMFACENAVKLAPKDLSIRNSRGVARALIGDKTGAIEDFQAYANSPEASKEDKAQRQGWIKDLKAGKDPFTDEVLQKLRQ